jgi:hypothetical protein
MSTDTGYIPLKYVNPQELTPRERAMDDSVEVKDQLEFASLIPILLDDVGKRVTGPSSDICTLFPQLFCVSFK